MKDIHLVFAEHAGPALFRMAWWMHLDPSRRSRFADELLDVVTDGIVRTLQTEESIIATGNDRTIARYFIEWLIDLVLGKKLKNLVPPFHDGTFEEFIRHIVEHRHKTEIDRLMALQYDAFTSRISNLSESLISAVTQINEEFIIWLKTHPDHASKIHSDAFEQLSGDILTSRGFTIEFTGRVKNISADLIALKANEDNEDIKYLIECKRYGLPSAGWRANIRRVSAAVVGDGVSTSWPVRPRPRRQRRTRSTPRLLRGRVARQAVQLRPERTKKNLRKILLT